MTVHSSQNMILWFFLVLFIGSLILLLWLLQPFVATIVLALVVAGMFSPVYRKLTKKMSITWASMTTCILIFFLLFIPIVFFVGALSTEALALIDTAKDAVLGDQFKKLLENRELIDKANIFLARFNISVTGDQIVSTLSEAGKATGLFLFKQANSIAANLFKFFVNFFFMLVIIFFFLIDSRKLLSFIVDLSPLPDEQDSKLIRKFKEMAGAVLVGNGLAGAIQGVAGGVVFALFGLGSPILWGFVMGILAFLPIMGIGLVFVPATLLLFLKGRFAAGLFFIVFYIFLMITIEYIFKPYFMGDRMQMHSLLVFLSIMGGLNAFGILGIIYGPLIVTAFLTLAEIYKASYQVLIDPESIPGSQMPEAEVEKL